MSLINKMLNELEKRKQATEPARLEILSSITQALKKYNFFESIPIRQIFISLLLLISVATILTYTYTTIIKPQKKLKTTKSTRAKKLPTANVMATKPTAILKEIILQPINNADTQKKTIMDFILNTPVIYYIERSVDQQQLYIVFKNTGLLGNVPVALENSLILSLNTKQNATDTVCTLTLLPGTEIVASKLITLPQTQLHLEFHNPQLQISNNQMSKVPVATSLEQEQEQRYQQIQQLLAQNNIKEAITQLYWFTADFTNNLPAREILVALLIKNNELHKADNILELGLSKTPGHLPFIKFKARILTEQGKNSAAIDLLQRHFADFTEDHEYFALLAVLYQKQGQFINAAKIYHQLTKMQPEKHTWWLGLGLALESAGKKNAAKEAYSHAYGS